MYMLQTAAAAVLWDGTSIPLFIGSVGIPKRDAAEFAADPRS